MGSPDVVINVLARDKGATSTFRKVGHEAERSSKRMSGAFSGLGKKLAGGLAVVGTVSVFKDFISQAEESRKVGRLTDAVLKSTGSVAGVTAKQVGDLATAISNKTGVDDEAIQSSANLLLTFTNVRNEVGKGNDIFSQATATITDMSVALGQDTKSSAIQLGKALNDPIKGVTALQRVGVSFTGAQKKQIKALVDSGKTLDAQKIILAELSKEFGGAAEAAASPSQKLAVMFGNLKEQVGGALLPAVDGLATMLGEVLIPWLSEAGSVVSTKFGPALSKVGEWVRTKVFPILSRFGGWIKDDLLPAFKKAADDILPRVREAFHSFGETIKGNRETFEKVGNILKTVGTVITSVVIPAIGDIVALWVQTLGPMFKAWVWAIDNLVIPAFRLMADVWFKVVGALVNGAASAFGWVPGLGDKLKSAAKEFNAFRDKVNDSLDGIKNRNVVVRATLTAGGGFRQVHRDSDFAVPQLAHGGVVRARNGGTLVNVGEAGRDEAVVPLGRGMRGMGDTYSITVQGAVDPLSTARQIEQMLARLKRERGTGLAFA